MFRKTKRLAYFAHTSMTIFCTVLSSSLWKNIVDGALMETSNRGRTYSRTSNSLLAFIDDPLCIWIFHTPYRNIRDRFKINWWTIWTWNASPAQVRKTTAILAEVYRAWCLNWSTGLWWFQSDLPTILDWPVLFIVSGEHFKKELLKVYAVICWPRVPCPEWDRGDGSSWGS